MENVFKQNGVVKENNKVDLPQTGVVSHFMGPAYGRGRSNVVCPMRFSSVVVQTCLPGIRLCCFDQKMDEESNWSVEVHCYVDTLHNTTSMFILRKSVYYLLIPSQQLPTYQNSKHFSKIVNFSMTAPNSSLFSEVVKWISRDGSS